MKTFLLSSILFLSTLLVIAEETKKETFSITESVSKDDQIVINGNTIPYTVSCGYLTLKTEYGTNEAHVFYVAYKKRMVKAGEIRPVTFSFNGGPGSSSVWMHLGMLGPKRVELTDEGMHLPPPYKLIDNEYSWLDKTDLVFIDPISTGFSRADQADKAKNYHGYQGDINSVGAFIQKYVTQEKLWAKPKYLIGESYGTLRAAALSGHLIDQYGMYLNGISLVSFVNNFQTLDFANGNDLPYVLFLPSYTASAWYHKRLDESLQNKRLEDVIAEAKLFAVNQYQIALFKGSELNQVEKKEIINKLSFYTGLSPEYIDAAELRVNSHQFRKELLRDSSKACGRFDARYSDYDPGQLREYAFKDPSYQPAVHGAYSGMINDYLTNYLGFKSEIPYEVLSGKVWPWDYSDFENEYVNVSGQLRKAMNKNPDMKVWIANGYYDLATPFFATEFTINHMNLFPYERKKVQFSYHYAGHMMYLHKPSLIEMKSLADQFYK